MAHFEIDPSHSEIVFKVKHLMITNVSGKFTSFSGSLDTTDETNFTDAKAHFEAEIASIDTNSKDRDTHLKSADFFNAEAYPKLQFNSTSIKVEDDEVKVTGDLTIKDVTKSVTLKGEFGGSVTDPYGQYKLGFEVSGKISRKEFGLTWNAVTEAGSVVVSDDIKLSIDVQFIKQA